MNLRVWIEMETPLIASILRLRLAGGAKDGVRRLGEGQAELLNTLKQLIVHSQIQTARLLPYPSK